MEEIIQVKNLNFTYDDGTVALENINITVNKGEFVALIGQNGCGKTTLSKCLNGILAPTSGEIIVGGLHVEQKPKVKELVKNIGYVFQNPDHQLFNSKVYDEIAYAPRNIGLEDKEVKIRVKEAASTAGVKEELFEEQPVLLMKGLRQRVAIASILSLKPQVIIVDEPTTGQDYRQSLEIMEFLKDLNEKHGHTILIITHEMHIVAQYAKRIMVMKKGEIYMDGTPAEIFSQPEKLKEGYVKPPMVTRMAQLLDASGEHNGVINIDEIKKLLEEGKMAL
jgi:energy-coupling factor transport system ATP-binding protein